MIHNAKKFSAFAVPFSMGLTLTTLELACQSVPEGIKEEYTLFSLSGAYISSVASIFQYIHHDTSLVATTFQYE